MTSSSSSLSPNRAHANGSRPRRFRSLLRPLTAPSSFLLSPYKSPASPLPFPSLPRPNRAPRPHKSLAGDRRSAAVFLHFRCTPATSTPSFDFNLLLTDMRIFLTLANIFFPCSHSSKTSSSSPAPDALRPRLPVVPGGDGRQRGHHPPRRALPHAVPSSPWSGERRSVFPVCVQAAPPPHDLAGETSVSPFFLFLFSAMLYYTTSCRSPVGLRRDPCVRIREVTGSIPRRRIRAAHTFFIYFHSLTSGSRTSASRVQRMRQSAATQAPNQQSSSSQQATSTGQSQPRSSQQKPGVFAEKPLHFVLFITF